MNKNIVNQQFLRSIVKWLAQAEDNLIQRFCVTLVVENPKLAEKVSNYIIFAFQGKQDDVEDKK